MCEGEMHNRSLSLTIALTIVYDEFYWTEKLQDI